MKIKGSKRIPDNDREQVKILAIEGLSDRNIGKKLNISKTAVNSIKNEIDNLDQLRTDKKRKMANELWDLAIRMKSHISDEKLRKTAAVSLTIAMATAIDKSLLLSGEVTERFELSRSEIDRKLSELDVAERELKDAWERARKEREKAAEEGNGGRPES
ncbi:hypothetical protein MUO65_07360 [bacterium]|nr:hypothetical protein [bacterium]